VNGDATANAAANLAHDLERLRAGERPTARDTTADARTEYARWRANVAHALLADLRPGDHALAVWLLEQERADNIASVTATDVDLLYCLIAAVARFAQAGDALLIWRAAQTTAETRVGVDVEQALRAGPDAVLRALERFAAGDGPEAEDARAALAWVREGIANGAASDLPAYFAWSDERFGLHVSGPT
jgi:hypothetical protein